MSTALPTFLYGTAWKEEETTRCVQDALAAGFRAIDTANQRKHYNEAGVGAALRTWFAQGRSDRDSLFLQTKFTSIRGQDQRLPYDAQAEPGAQVEQSFQSSLEHLQIEYVDSYVLHGPQYSTGLSESDWLVWRAMEKLAVSGKAKFLGISNVTLDQLTALFEGASVKPRFVQNRCYARTAWDQKLRQYCRAKGIVYQGFSLLTANREVFASPALVRVVERLGCTPAQAVFALARQLGILPLTGTTDPSHMREDLSCADFELTRDEVESLENGTNLSEARSF